MYVWPLGVKYYTLWVCVYVIAIKWSKHYILLTLLVSQWNTCSTPPPPPSQCIVDSAFLKLGNGVSPISQSHEQRGVQKRQSTMVKLYNKLICLLFVRANELCPIAKGRSCLCKSSLLFFLSYSSIFFIIPF